MNGTRRERPDRREGKKHAGGMFFSSGESPIDSRTQSEGLWTAIYLTGSAVKCAAAREGIYFISLYAKRKISQWPKDIISHERSEYFTYYRQGYDFLVHPVGMWTETEKK